MLMATGLGATQAQAAPASASASAKAKVLKQLALTKNVDLDFGTIVAGASASTVVVNAAGTATCGAGLTCSGTTTAANFKVEGSNNSVVTVSVPASVSLANQTVGSSATMSATFAAPATLLLTTSGSAGTPLVFGGTLNIGASQEEGVYNGTFNVTVDYQ
ncbi:MAG TPA: DUF4402 domain-containing protein [Allosphingosinicella sp.]|uniref:DUF4402 domain-containing protein n=1 Tax=Allosphingosinicella sp. TaxID=2823234 RepID=UPI002EDAC9A4